MSLNKDRDVDFMGAALSLARRGLGNTHPNPAVGCLLVKEGHVIARGWTQPGGRPHAEAMALDAAGAAARGATAYVTLEPCAHHGETPPCAEKLVQAGVARVVVAITDPDDRVAGRGLEILRKAGIEVVEDIRREDAWRTNSGFFLTRTDKRPLFTLKLATDADGLIPGPDAAGEAKWITSPEARLRGHLLRANHDAVLFGIGTVRADDPEYSCRLAGLEDQSPVRVLLDSQLTLSSDSKLLKSLDKAPLWIVCGSAAPEALGTYHHLQNVKKILRAPTARPELPWIARTLAEQGLTRVLIESGPTLASAALNANLVDEVAWFRAAKHLGEEGVPAFHAKSLEKLAFTRQAVLNAGPDQLELYIRKA